MGWYGTYHMRQLPCWPAYTQATFAVHFPTAVIFSAVEFCELGKKKVNPMLGTADPTGRQSSPCWVAAANCCRAPCLDGAYKAAQPAQPILNALDLFRRLRPLRRYQLGMILFGELLFYLWAESMQGRHQAQKISSSQHT